MDLSKLKEKFHENEIEWRIGRCGTNDKGPWAKVLAYVTNRAIMNRLDEVCGPENWHNEYKAGPLGGILCGLSIRCEGGWVTKWDGAENTDIEAVKGGLSDSMKRAAVQWGIGRYLYDLDEGWAEIVKTGGRYYQSKGNFEWNPPALPAWALPKTAPKTNGKPVNIPGVKTGAETWSQAYQDFVAWLKSEDMGLTQDEGREFVRKVRDEFFDGNAAEMTACKDESRFFDAAEWVRKQLETAETI